MLKETAVLVPYTRFLECRERRFGITAELTAQDERSTVETAVLPARTNDERERDDARVPGTDSTAGVQES